MLRLCVENSTPRNFRLANVASIKNKNVQLEKDLAILPTSLNYNKVYDYFLAFIELEKANRTQI